jgi:hypothetical protein
MLLMTIQSSSPSPWPSVVVALSMMAVVTGLTVYAMRRDGMDGAMKMWGAMGTIIGVLTGGVSTYFFTREATQILADEVSRSSERATVAAEEVGNLRVELQQERFVARTLEDNVVAKQALIDVLRRENPQVFDSP